MPVFGRLAALTAALLASDAAAQDPPRRTPSPQGAEVYFHAPLPGATVSSPFTVRIGLRNMGVAPAGIAKDGTGHHHLLVDTALASFDVPIPNDHQHLHLGNGQTELLVSLPPGRHTLQLVVGDHDHVPHRPPVLSRPLTITVRGGNAAAGR